MSEYRLAALPRRRFGRLGWRLCPFGLGGAWLGGRGVKWTIDESAAIVHAALALGIDFIDTSRRYGNSEVILGHALADWPRDLRPIIATKSQVVAEEPSIADAVVKSCEESLERLRVDVIDLFQLHEAELYGWDRVMAPGGALEGLQRCRDRGYCRGIGVTGRSVDLLTRLVQTDAFDSVLTYYEYDLLTAAGAKELLPAAAARDVAVILGSPARMGVFAKEDPTRLARHPEEIRARVEPLEQTVGRPVHEMADLALRYLLDDPRAAQVVVGVSRVETVVKSVEAVLRGPLPADLQARLRLVSEQVAQVA